MEASRFLLIRRMMQSFSPSILQMQVCTSLSKSVLFVPWKFYFGINHERQTIFTETLRWFPSISSYWKNSFFFKSIRCCCVRLSILLRYSPQFTFYFPIYQAGKRLDLKIKQDILERLSFLVSVTWFSFVNYQIFLRGIQPLLRTFLIVIFIFRLFFLFSFFFNKSLHGCAIS